MTNTKCSRHVCDKPAKYGCRGMCESDYRRTVRKGINGYVPTESVREHIAKLRALGWTWVQISEAAGVSTWVPHKAGTGRTRWMLKDRADAVLRVPLTPQVSHRGVDSAGTRRRVQALAWMGWTTAEVARRAGTTANTLRTLILPDRRVSFSLAHRVAEVYEQLSHLQGPSKGAAGKARQLNFAPPLAWDEDTIDAPTASPDLGVSAPRRREVVAEDARFLASTGMTTHGIAARLRVSELYVRGLLSSSRAAA
jgi:hypothetical protein